MAGLEIRKLAPARPGVARFAATCECGVVTILHVPVAHAIGADIGGFECDGCRTYHRVAIAVAVNGRTG